MKRILIVTILMAWKISTAFSQDTVYVLHPIIGELIDKQERKDYLLFTEFNDSSFYYCFVKYGNGKFYVTARFQKDSVEVEEVDLATLKQYHQNIEKLNQYYILKAKRNSSDRADNTRSYNDSKQVSSEELRKRIITPGTMNQINKEVIRDQRLKDDAERMNLWKRDGGVVPLNIELF